MPKAVIFHYQEYPLIGHFVRRKDRQLIRASEEASFDRLVCVSMTPFTVVSEGANYRFAGQLVMQDFEPCGFVPDGVWSRCARKGLGPLLMWDALPLRQSRPWYNVVIPPMPDYDKSTHRTELQSDLCYLEPA